MLKGVTQRWDQNTAGLLNDGQSVLLVLADYRVLTESWVFVLFFVSRLSGAGGDEETMEQKSTEVSTQTVQYQTVTVRERVCSYGARAEWWQVVVIITPVIGIWWGWLTVTVMPDTYDVISSVPFSLECYRLFVDR